MPGGPMHIDGADAAVACFSYGGPISIAIHRLKYGGRLDVGRALGQAVRDELERLGPFDLVVPVPLSPARLRQRGYNQARELVRGVPWPVATAAVMRPGGKPQAGLNAKQRERNVAGAFGVADAARVRSRRIAVVDDVVTTGSTARAVVAALHAAKAEHVAVVSLARAELGAAGV